MKKKILLILSIVFLLTGCDNVYNLTIEDDTIREEIISIIPDYAAEDADKEFIKEEHYPWIDNKTNKYRKVVQKSGDNTIVSLSYDYSINEFKTSRVYNECFEKSIIKKEDGYLKFAFGGEFYCLYGDSLEVNLRSNRTVENNNAESIDKDEGVYTWKINRKNMNDVDIQFVLGETNELDSSSILTIFFVILFVIIVIVDILLLKSKKKKKKNKR